MYSVSNAPTTYKVEELASYVQNELAAIAAEFVKIANGELLVKLSVAPTKKREGMVVLADGTHWNPGSGAGAYCYYGGAWHFLG